MSEPRIVYLREGEAAVENHTRNYLSGLLAGIIIALVAVYLARVLIGGGPGEGEPAEVDESDPEGAERSMEAVDGGAAGAAGAQ